MDADVAWMSAKSLKAHKREGAAAFRLAKKARVEETDPAAFCLDRPEPVLVAHLRVRVLPDPMEGGSHRGIGRRSQKEGKTQSQEEGHACRHCEVAEAMAQNGWHLHVLRR